MRRRRRVFVGAAALCALVALSACGQEGMTRASGRGESPAATPTQAEPTPTEPTAATPTPATPTSATQTPTSQPTQTPTQPPADPAHTVELPGPFTGAESGADLLVYATTPLTDDQVRAIRAVAQVTDSELFSLAQVAVQDQILQIAAVDLPAYRRFAPNATAQEQQVWDRLAGGEIAVDQKTGTALQDETGSLRLGNDASAASVHIGAYAPQVPQIDAIVNTSYASTLGMPPGNAMLLATGAASPQSVRPLIQQIVGDDISVQILGPNLDITVQQTAVLTGGSVAAAVGSFSYTVLGGGRIAPDPAWVRANIRTAEVPILGTVTCHRVVLPQLRAAFTEIQARGLASAIHPDEYAGCFYPRFIAGTTKLSLHSFGIALDLNVPGNQRGTAGQMDRTVVSIFKKWGFAWGGDWNWTDPMHFEMNRVVEPR